MPKQASNIAAEEPAEQSAARPIIADPAARPGKKDGPQHGVIGVEDQSMRPRGVIRTEDQDLPPRGVAQNEQPTSPRSSAQRAKLLQRKLGNRRTGEAMATMFGADDKTAKPPPITTPLPQGTKRQPTGEAILAMPGGKVVVLPDTHNTDPTMQGQARTHGNLTWSLPGWEEEDGKITSIEAQSAPLLTIQTEYGPGVTASSPSAYGRGTTPADVKAGQTSLGFHEGNHGLDFMRYVQAHPLPKLIVRKGMGVEAFQAARDAYNEKMQAYQAALEAYSRKMTDCVGTPDAGC